ncbi:MAG: response regulator [Rickettsiales bacterium]|nr:response regulator [Rickettsiales bacterium]
MTQPMTTEKPSPLPRFMAIFFAALIIILSTSTLVHEADRYAIFLFVLILLLGGLFAICYRFMKQQDELTSLARFQTALFSAAARNQSAFYLIIRDGKTVEFTDTEFQKSFPDAAALAPKGLKAMMDSLQLPEEAQRTLNHAITTHQNAFIKETLVGEEEGDFILSYESLNKPDEYGVLRGRPFVERENLKTGEAPAEEAKQEASAAIITLDTSPLEPFIANSPLAAACLDMNGKITSSNASFRELTDTTDKPAGWHFIEAVDDENRADITARLDSLNTESAETSPLDVTMESNKEHSAMLYFSRYEKRNGDPQILLHLIDTTEQKSLEVKYAHSQKMQAVGQLAGGVAHDFNNLLTAMIGFCDLLLQRHPAGDQSFADIMQVKQNANRAANLVRQLLAFSRRQTLQPKMLELTDVVAELSNLIRRLIGESIDLKVVHGRDIGHVKADQGQLEQVFINLAVNARDAMGDGGMLTLNTSVIDIKNAKDLDDNLVAPPEEDPIQPGNYVLVEFVDTGCGIEPEGLQKIFEPFFSTKEVGAGTGLGLATVYGIIKQTGGYVYVDSKLGEGTRFCLYFPRYELEAGAAAAAAAIEIETPADLTGDSTILLVEDEEPVRNFAARALRNKGYTVLEADCGEQAIEVIEEHGDKLDVIVSDVIMPGMNGPEMIKKIVPDHPNVKIIFISGYAEDAFTDSFGDDYEFNFLPKPFTLKQLAAKIKEVENE